MGLDGEGMLPTGWGEGCWVLVKVHKEGTGDPGDCASLTTLARIVRACSIRVNLWPGKGV